MTLDPQSDRRLRRWIERLLREAKPGREVEGGFRIGKDGRIVFPWIKLKVMVVDEPEEKA